MNGDLYDEETLNDLEAAQAKIAALEEEVQVMRNKEVVRLGKDFTAFLTWCRQRERLTPDDNLFYAYEDAWKKAKALIEPLRSYIDCTIYKDVLFSAGLHYIIVEPFTFEVRDESGNTEEIENPLYKKFSIANKQYLISSASDESSSSSVHVTKSLQDGDFLMQDLLRTRYGTWVYSILEQLDIGAVLL